MRTSALFILICTCALYSVCAVAQKAYLPHDALGGNPGITVVNTDLKYTVTNINGIYTLVAQEKISPDGSKVYIGYNDYNDRILSVVDTKRDTITSELKLQTTASLVSIAVSPDNSKIYCAVFSTDSSKSNDSILVVNLATMSVELKMVVAQPSQHMGDVVASPDGKKLYLATDNRVEVLDAATGALLATVAAQGTAFPNIGSMTISPDGSRLYAADISNQRILAINTLNNTIVTTLAAGARPYTDDPVRIVISPDGKRLYADNPSSMGISAIDISSDTILYTILPSPFFPPYTICLSLDGTTLYALTATAFNNQGVLSVVNASDGSLRTNINLVKYPRAFGDFVNGPAPDTTKGNFVVPASAAPVVSGTAFVPLQNGNGQTYAEINANNNNLGATAWGASVGAGTSLQTSFGYFGGDKKQNGAFLDRSLFAEPASQPTSAATMRIYCTSAELKAFIDSFNIKYGMTLTEKDIRIVKYDGSNVDLSRSNNDDNATAYASITPSQVGYYGFSNAYRYFEFPVSSFSEFYITLAVPDALPVSLTRFTAEKKNSDVVLNWQAATVENVSHFVVERSADRKAFTNLTSVYASDNTAAPQLYSATDHSPVSPVSFYRLQIVDKDGGRSYSQILRVDFGSGKTLTVYPNPAGRMLTIQLNAGDKKAGDIRIVDANGRLVKLVATAGDDATKVTVDISGLAKGIYSVIAGSAHTSFVKGD